MFFKLFVEIVSVVSAVSSKLEFISVVIEPSDIADEVA